MLSDFSDISGFSELFDFYLVIGCSGLLRLCVFEFGLIGAFGLVRTSSDLHFLGIASFLPNFALAHHLLTCLICLKFRICQGFGYVGVLRFFVVGTGVHTKSAGLVVCSRDERM